MQYLLYENKTAYYLSFYLYSVISLTLPPAIVAENKAVLLRMGGATLSIQKSSREFEYRNIVAPSTFRNTRYLANSLKTSSKIFTASAIRRPRLSYYSGHARLIVQSNYGNRWNANKRTVLDIIRKKFHVTNCTFLCTYF